MMNELKLSNLLTPKNILLDVKEKEKDALLAKIIKTFSEVNNIADPEALAREVTEREALGNTGIGRGIGFPHAKSSQVEEISVLLARPARPIEYGALDGLPVNLVILIIAPDSGDNNQYLHAMARISRLLGKSEVREKRAQVKTPQEAIDTIAAFEN